MTVVRTAVTRAAKAGLSQGDDSTLESVAENAQELQDELRKDDPSSFFVTLQVAQIVGELSGELNDTIDKLRAFKNDQLKPAASGLRTTERVANRLEPIFERLEDVPVSVVRKAAKALSIATDVYGDAAGNITPTLTRVERRLDQLDAKAAKFQKVLKVFGTFDEVAGALETLREKAIELAERDEADALVIEAALLKDLDATVSDDGGTITFDAPEPVAARINEAMDVFDARLAARSEAIREVLDRIDDFIDRVFDLAPDLGDLPDAPTLPQIEAVFDDFFQRFQDEISRVLDAIDALGVLDVIGFLGDLGDVLDDFASILDKVMDAVQPILDFFGPVISLINEAIEEIEDAVGLTDLLERVEQGIRNEIDKVIDQVNEVLDEIFDEIELPDITILEQLSLDMEFLRGRIGFFELNPVAQIGSDSTLVGDSLDDRAIIAALDGDDRVELPLDRNFNDGFGGMALAGDGDDTVEGSALADLAIGGEGDDRLFGRAGDDVLMGVNGTDVISGGFGDDQAVGGDGADVISGDAGDDMIFGEAGLDFLFGGAGDDLIGGGDDDDRLEGGSGDDELDGGAGEDLLIATEGANLLDGGAGLDVIRTIGEASAVHTIVDPSAVLVGGTGVDIVSLGDLYGIGGPAFLDPDFGRVFFDVGANVDRFHAGDLDLDRLVAKLVNFETLEITAGLGETKTLSTDTSSIQAFDLLEVKGDGRIVVAVTDGVFRMDGDDRQIDIDFNFMPTAQNLHDGPAAGGDRPISDVIDLVVRLDEPGGGTVFGPEASGIGVTFQGGAGDDFIVGGSGSDLILPGLGADIVDGGRGDDGDRFVLDGAIGDVILGTPEELDGDTILNFSNRVDRVRVIGETVELVSAGDKDSTIVSIFEDGLDTGFEFTLMGNFPKLRVEEGSFLDVSGSEVFFTEIFNNNVPPTAVDDDIETSYQGPGDDDLPLDPFENDFDADTPADPEDGVERRQVAITESLAFLLRQIVDENGDPVPFEDEDGTRIVFNQGIDPVPVGTAFVTRLGNKLILTDAGLVYEARDPEIVMRRTTGDDPGVQEGEDDGRYNLSQDVPFFGLDQIEYKVFDTEGELSNVAAIDILVRPDPITLADGSTALPTVLVRGETVDGAAEDVVATLNVVPDGQNAPDSEPEFFLNFTEDLAEAVGFNDYFEITTPGSYFGGLGDDVLDARGATGTVSLFGGRKADWLEGGAFDDFLSGGGVGDHTLNVALAMQSPLPTESELSETTDDDTFAPQPDILIGGDGDNVYSASYSFVDDTATPRETLYILNGGAEKVIGPTHNVELDGQGGQFSLNPVPFAGPTALAALALDGDRIDGFDQDDYVILPINIDPLASTTTIDRAEHSTTVSAQIPNPLFNPSLPTGPEFFTHRIEARIDATYVIPHATGLIVTAKDVAGRVGQSNGSVLNNVFSELDLDVLARAQGSTVTVQKVTENLFANERTVEFTNGFDGAPQILTYDIDADFIDDNGGATPTTKVTVSMESFFIELAPQIAGFDVGGLFNVNYVAPNPFTDILDVASFQQTYNLTATLRRDPGLIDRNNLIQTDDGDITMTFELEGHYRDRFVIDLVPMAANASAQTVEFGDAVGQTFGSGASAVAYLTESEVAELAADGQLGFALRYVSAAPEPVADAATVRRGEAITFDLTANDSDSDGDPIGIFDIVFDSAAQEAALLDGDESNGELILEVDPVSGFGTGLVTYIAPADFTGEVAFRYIAEDGEFQSDPTGVAITVTGLPPVLGDDVFVLPFATDGFIAFADIFANDFEPDAFLGQTLDFASLATDPTLGGVLQPRLVAPEDVGPDDVAIPAGDMMAIGFEIPSNLLDGLRADAVGDDGEISTSLPIVYTLDDAETGETAQAATVTVAVAEAFDLAPPAPLVAGIVAADAPAAIAAVTEPPAFTVDEDSAIAIDLLSGRVGGFGDAEVVAVSPAVAEGTDIVVGDVVITADGILFTPLPDLAGIVATFTATARDQAGQEATVEVRVGVTPVDDAPDVTVLTPAGDPTLLEATEDVPIAGTLFIADADAADPNVLGLEGALELLALLAGDPASLDPTALAALADALPVPADFGPIATSAGGSLTLAATATPGLFEYVFASLEDVNGGDLARIVLLPLPGESDGDEAFLPIFVDPVNDAPTFAGVPSDPSDPTVFEAGGVLAVDLLALADDIDGAIDPPSLQIDAGPSADVATATLTPEGVLELTGVAAGVGSLTFSVADDEGLRSAPQTLHFRVNAAPVANDDVIRVASADPVVIDAIANDTDLEGAVFYRLGPDGVPEAIAPPGSGETEGASETLGTVVFDETLGAFVYTPPSDPALRSGKDFFFYEIEDEDGATARGDVVIDLVDPAAGGTELRVGSVGSDTVTAGPGLEVFVLGDGPDTVEGPLANFDGDEFLDFAPDDRLLFTAPTDGDVTVTAVRERTARPDAPAFDPDAPDLAGLLGGDSVEDLSDAFIGDTVVTVSIGDETAVMRLLGAFPGAFTATSGPDGVSLTYAPTAEGPGQLDGGEEDDDLRGPGVLNGNGGDDILQADGAGAVLNGGAGADVLFAGGGAGFVTMTGGPGADLFLIINGAAPYDILDYNPTEGDRIGIAQSAFFNDDLTPNLDLLTLARDGDPADDVFLLTGLPEDAEADDLPVTLARIAFAVAVNAPPTIASDAFEVEENESFVGAIDAADSDGDDLTFSIVAGGDGAAFTIDPVTGALSFLDAPDFEAPADQGGDNVYNLRVSVDDGAAETTQDIVVAVLDVDENAGGGEENGGDGNDFLRGGDGDDRLNGKGGDDVILAGGGDDVANGGAGNDTINGGDGDDALIGGDGEDILRGNDGDDAANGNDGDDILIGSGGDDTLRGNDGADLANGGAGDDILVGGDGDDILRGDIGDDVANGGGGDDVVMGGDGNDILRGNEGEDVLNGKAGEDMLFGGDDADMAFGGDGDDRLRGDGGNDRLFGQDGSDVLRGGDGDDVLFGGLGRDYLEGGAGADLFVLTETDAADVILDFEIGIDSINVPGADIGAVREITFAGAASTEATSDSGVTVTLHGVVLADFNELIA